VQGNRKAREILNTLFEDWYGKNSRCLKNVNINEKFNVFYDTSQRNGKMVERLSDISAS
jgi:hypothetical protein